MAIITATSGKLDMSDLGFDRKGSAAYGPSNIRLTYDDGGYTDFGGAYQFSQTGVTGTVQSITNVEAGVTTFTATDLNADAQTLFGYIETGDVLGAAAYALRDDDTITGGRRADTLYGFGGDDTLSGGRGADTLVGGEGKDTLKGGADNDTFAYWAKEDSGTHRGDRDTIVGFSHADMDKIDLSAIDANEHTEGTNEAFTVVGAFTGHAGELTITQVASGWLVAGDTDGRHGADFSILVKSLDGPVVATDFQL